MLMFLVSNIVGSTIQITTLPLPVLSTLQAVRQIEHAVAKIPSAYFLYQSGLVFNSICATVVLGEPFTSWSLIGTILVAIGAMLIALYGALSEPSHRLNQLLFLLGRRQFLVWIFFTMIAVVAILIGAWLLRRAHLRDRPRWRLVRGMSYGAVSGILSAHCLLVAKSAVELLVRTIVDKRNQFKHWQSWIILLALVVLALTQLYYLHLGLKLCSTSVLYPFVFCIYNVIAIMDGLIYFRQVSRLSVAHAGLIALGTVILLSGVVALSWRLQDDDVGVALSSSADLDASTPLLGHSRARSSTTAASLAPGLYLVTKPDPLADEGEDTHASSRALNDEEAHAAALSSPAITEASPLLPNSGNSALPKFSWFSRHGHRNSQSSATSGPATLHQRSRRSSRTLPSVPWRPRRPVTVHETAELWAELNDDCDSRVNGRKNGSMSRNGYEGGYGHYSKRFGHKKRRSTSGASFSFAGGDDSNGNTYQDRGGMNGIKSADLRLDRRASSGGYLSTKPRPAAVGAVGREELEGVEDVKVKANAPPSGGDSKEGPTSLFTSTRAELEKRVESADTPTSRATGRGTGRGTDTDTDTDKNTATARTPSNDDKVPSPCVGSLPPLSSSSSSPPPSSPTTAAAKNNTTDNRQPRKTSEGTDEEGETDEDGDGDEDEGENEDEDKDKDKRRDEGGDDNPSITHTDPGQPSTLSSLWRRIVSGTGRET